MAILHFKDVGISAMAACVPHTVIDNYKYTQYFPEEEVRKIYYAMITFSDEDLILARN